MNYRRYTFEAPFGALAENLVNSLDESLEVPEHLSAPADLAAFLAAHGISWPRRPTVADLEAVRAVRLELRGLFTAHSQSEAAQRLNALLEGARVNMHVARERGGARIEWSVDDSIPLAEALRSAAAVRARARGTRTYAAPPANTAAIANLVIRLTEPPAT